MTNDEGTPKINSRTLSESNDERFLQRVAHILGLRHSPKEIPRARKLSGRGMTQRLGACIVSTAIMLPRNISAKTTRAIEIAVRNKSFSSL